MKISPLSTPETEPSLGNAEIVKRAVRVGPERLSAGKGLQDAIHHLLVFGVGLSSSLMILGLLLDFFEHLPVPTSLPPVGETLQSLLALQPSGFIGVGLLALIATPIVRVFGSMLAFFYERDWRYAGITLLVLMIVMTSILLGKG